MSQDRYRDEHAPHMPGFAPFGIRFELAPGATSSVTARGLTGASEGAGSLQALYEERDALRAEVALARNVGDTIAKVREIAKALGWAIGAHGSLVRDIDLIAVPWTLSASSWRVLVAAVAAGIGCRSRPQDGERAHGRICVLLIADGADNDQLRFNRGETTEPPNPKGQWYPPAIDLSIIDPRNGSGVDGSK